MMRAHLNRQLEAAKGRMFDRCGSEPGAREWTVGREPAARGLVEMCDALKDTWTPIFFRAPADRRAVADSVRTLTDGVPIELPCLDVSRSGKRRGAPGIGCCGWAVEGSVARGLRQGARGWEETTAPGFNSATVDFTPRGLMRLR